MVQLSHRRASMLVLVATLSGRWLSYYVLAVLAAVVLQSLGLLLSFINNIFSYLIATGY
ncbi:hypothetical protein GIB67_003679, partial [Kingdonia uniflora]